MSNGQVSDEQWTQLASVMSGVHDAPLLINTTPGASPPALCEQVAELDAVESINLVAVDPMNRIDADLDPDTTREREVSVIVGRLKLLALELDVPVVITAELGRSVEQRIGKNPTVSDLHDSDTPAEVAGKVVLIHRPDAYECDHPRGEASLILGKHRNGPTKTITVAYQLHLGRFANMAKAPTPFVGSQIRCPFLK